MPLVGIEISYQDCLTIIEYSIKNNFNWNMDINRPRQRAIDLIENSSYYMFWCMNDNHALRKRFGRFYIAKRENEWDGKFSLYSLPHILELVRLGMIQDITRMNQERID